MDVQQRIEIIQHHQVVLISSSSNLGQIYDSCCQQEIEYSSYLCSAFAVAMDELQKFQDKLISIKAPLLPAARI